MQVKTINGFEKIVEMIRFAWNTRLFKQNKGEMIVTQTKTVAIGNEYEEKYIHIYLEIDSRALIDEVYAKIDEK